MEHFDGCSELVEDDCSLFRDSTAQVLATVEKPISPKLLWYLGSHPERDE